MEKEKEKVNEYDGLVLRDSVQPKIHLNAVSQLCPLNSWTRVMPFGQSVDERTTSSLPEVALLTVLAREMSSP